MRSCPHFFRASAAPQDGAAATPKTTQCRALESLCCTLVLLSAHATKGAAKEKRRQGHVTKCSQEIITQLLFPKGTMLLTQGGSLLRVRCEARRRSVQIEECEDSTSQKLEVRLHSNLRRLLQRCLHDQQVPNASRPSSWLYVERELFLFSGPRLVVEVL